MYRYKYAKYSQKIMQQNGGRQLKEHLSQPFFDDVRSGRKKYEGRLNKPGKFLLDDIITWYNDDDNNYQEFTTRISKISVYDTFEEAIETVGLENILPSEYEKGSTVKQAIQNVYRRWYSEEKENEFRVILLEFELL